MNSPQQRRLVGADYLHAITSLAQRVRSAHPTEGLFEAADFQWWWRTPRSTDEIEQLFWFEAFDRPVAAVVLTDWGDGIALDPILMPDADTGWIERVVNCGLAHAAECGFPNVELEVDSSDDDLQEILISRGFKVDKDGLVETWLEARHLPEISPLRSGYQLRSRIETVSEKHHMVRRSGPEVEPRLGQTSLYRPDLDLAVLDVDDSVAAYGLFWFDPKTATGLVEPMRTEEEHQRRGLARHLLTAGVDRLIRAGAERIKICYEPDNPASGNLYRSVGFEPVKETVILSGPTSH